MASLEPNVLTPTASGFESSNGALNSRAIILMQRFSISFEAGYASTWVMFLACDDIQSPPTYGHNISRGLTRFLAVNRSISGSIKVLANPAKLSTGLLSSSRSS